MSPPSSEPHPFTPGVASLIMRLIDAETRRRRTNGLGDLPDVWPVYVWLGSITGLEINDRPDNGTASVTLGAWMTASAAADKTGVSVEYVRRLARQGRVRSQRAGPRALLIDLDSLRSVLRKAAA